jgi:putative heme-binding domain-containing protein
VVKPLLAPPRPFVKKWDTAEVVKLAQKGMKHRNFDKGRAMFAATNCFACHRFNNEGGSTGPDLTAVSGRFGIQDLVESITEPSKVISDQYQAVVIELNNGQVIQGRVVNLFGDSITINTDLYDPNKLVPVNRNQIASVNPSPISMMPTGLLDTLHDEEVLDLLAYLLSGGNRNNPMFVKKE